MAALTLTTFGALKAAAKAESGARELARGKPVALLAFLAASPGRRASRERLASLLWSDGSSEAARQNLRQTIWYIKRRLGDWLVASDDFLELVPDVDVDRDRFLVAVREQRLHDAIEAYTGEFVPDFAAPGAADFEQWADIERRRLRGVFVSCCDTLARQSLAAGHFSSAVELAKRARDAAPLDLSTWRLLLESLTASRDAIAAVAEVEHLEALAASEDLEVDAATRAALRAARAIAGGTGGAVGAASSGQSAGTAAISGADRAGGLSDEAGSFAPELIGREAEFRALISRWEAARDGRGGAVLVSGVAGLGKSRLLGDFHARLRASRSRVLLLRANPGDRAVAGGFIAAVAESVAQRPGSAAISEESANVLVALAPALASTFPRARPDAATGEDALRRRANAVLDLIRAVSEESALALLIDDIHWADSESRRVLDTLAARLDGGRVLLVLAARPPLETLGGFATLPRFELQRFDLPRVAEFVTRLGELPPERWGAELPSQLHTVTRGIPLALVETLARLVETGALVLSEQRWSSAVPAQIAEVLREGMVLEARVKSLTPSGRELLVLLAAFGRPIDEALLRLEGAPLVELEHRGFVTRSAAGICVAHDEIAAAALGSATDAECQHAHRKAATVLAEAVETDLTLSLAAHHARTGDDRPLLGQVVRRWIRRQRAQGHGGSAQTLLEELFGDEVPRDERRRLERVLPWWQRPARGVLGAAAAAATAVLLLAGFAWLREPVEPVLELVLKTQTTNPRFYRVVVPSLNDWSAGEPLQAEEVDAADLPVDLTQHARLVLTGDPWTDGWIGAAMVADSGGDEVVIADAAGKITQPILYRGDDGGPDVSPDGRLVVFASARWHPETDRYNLAVWDRETDQVRRLTATDDVDGSPRWSPDGTRIAFFRRYYTAQRPSSVCVTTVDGADLRCEWASAGQPTDIVNWLDDEHVVFVHRDTRELRRLNVESGAVVSLGAGLHAQRLPDPRLALVRMARSGEGRNAVALRRTDGPAALRPILVGGEEVDAVVGLARASFRTRPVERLSVVVPPNSIPVDLTHLLRVEAFTRDGTRRRAFAVRFASLDDSIARVVDDRLVPHRPGLVRVVATAGGWRSDTATFRVGPSTARDVLEERWSDGWESRWRTFGDPRPRRITRGSRTALNPNGDGRYASGLYYAREIPARDGVGVEFDVTLPLTQLHWQEIGVALNLGDIATHFGGWDHVTGFAPGLARSFCGSAFGQEGADNRVTIPLVRSQQEELRAPTPPGLYDGSWHRVRLQVFPDGSCGLAIDGRPLLRHLEPAPLDSLMTLIFTGHSDRTQVGIGTVRVWTGVKGGVDWSALDALAK